jgi:hypothetical protein
MKANHQEGGFMFEVNLGRYRTRVVTCVIVALGFGFAFASSANAGTTWLVTVDVSHTSANQEVPTFNVESMPAGAPDCKGPTPIADPTKGDVQICLGDKIYWKFTTSNRHGHLTIHEQDGVLGQKWFKGDEQGSLPIGGTSVWNTPDSTHNYCIAIYDKNGSGRLFTYDPKVIIGKGSSVEFLLDDITENCNKLLILDDGTEVRDRAKKICDDAQKIKELLKQQ